MKITFALATFVSLLHFASAQPSASLTQRAVATGTPGRLSRNHTYLGSLQPRAANPIQIRFPAGTAVVVACDANAANLQRVGVTFPNGTVVNFQGSGEPASLKYDDTNGSPQGAIGIRAQQDPFTLSFLFQFSVDGGQTFTNARVQDPASVNTGSPLTTTTITSEDDADDDFNDSLVTIHDFPQPSPPSH